MERSITLSQQPVSEDKLYFIYTGTIKFPEKKSVHVSFTLKSPALRYCFQVQHIHSCHFYGKAALQWPTIFMRKY